MTRVRKLAVTAAVIGLVLVVSRVGLPYFLTWRINAELRDLPNYTGHVDDVDLALWRGAYALKGLEIRQREHDFVVDQAVDPEPPGFGVDALSRVAEPVGSRIAIAGPRGRPAALLAGAGEAPLAAG